MADETRRSTEESGRDAAGQQQTAHGGGMPGDGVGRREDPGHTGVWPASGAEPPADAAVRPAGGWGQGAAGAAGYEDSGTSELGEAGEPGAPPAAPGSEAPGTPGGGNPG